MIKHNVRKLHYLLILIFLPVIAFAQSADEPSSLLPDINPQDIEIRGEFRPRFTGITRQPILGFNPTPRVFRIDPNRMPFLETPEQVVASLPLAQLEAELGPPRNLFQFPTRSNVLGYLGFGMFNSPEARLFVSAPLGSRGAVYSDVFFSSSEGHLENQAIQGSFRRLHGDVTYRHQLSLNSEAWGGVRGRYDFSPASIDFDLNSRLDLNVVGAHGGWARATSAFDFMKFGLSVNHTSTDNSRYSSPIPGQLPGFPILPNTMSENRFTLDGELSRTGRRPGHIFKFETSHDFGFYEFQQNDEFWHVSELSGYWNRQLNNGNRLNVGLRAFFGQDELSGAVFRAYPYVQYQFKAFNGFHFDALFSGEMRNHGLEDALITNRHAIAGGQLVNEQRVFGNLRTELDLANMITVHGFLNASYTSRPRMFTANNGSWVHPKELFLLQPGGGVSVYVMPELLMLYSSFSINIYDLNDTVFESFQNLERYRFTSGIRSTPAKNLSLRSWFDIIGPRKNELPQNPGLQVPDTGNIFLLNAQAEYRINGVVGVYVKAYNLLNQSYRLWPFFEERPLQIYGGVTFKF